jgi:ribosome biogenesis GTPase
MGSRRRKDTQQKDRTAQYLSGDVDEDRVERKLRFTDRAKNAQQEKTMRTTLMRAAEVDPELLPTGQVIQIHSLFSEVIDPTGVIYLSVMRKTLSKTSDTSIVVGDCVRYRATGTTDDSGRPEAVIEQILPRKTIVTRAQSFKGHAQQPIVANADQMLIVASLRFPTIKWGLIDRMLIAAQSGGLAPILCINKSDLPDAVTDFDAQAIAHYRTLKITVLQTSATTGAGLDDLRQLLKDKVTVLAGHSGVGKSSLIRAIQPHLDIRIGAISNYNEKGRHTTTSTRRYPLDFGGYVIDTPGIKQFGLWLISRENLIDYFPDVASETAPEWRKESYEHIAESLA